LLGLLVLLTLFERNHLARAQLMDGRVAEGDPRGGLDRVTIDVLVLDAAGPLREG